MPTITRDLYKFCASVADENHVVLTMDFAKNLTLPSAAETPSEWYFLSLISVSMFGIHDEHQKKQTNFLYSERKGKKGPNEVISMLDRYVDTREPSSRTLSVFADNCGGQNKNNFVLKYLVALAHTGLFKEINYNFFIKGHTKNSCDRGFGVIRRKIAKSTLYTMRQLHDAVMEASVSSERVLLEEEPAPFRDFKKSLDELSQRQRHSKVSAIPDAARSPWINHLPSDARRRARRVRPPVQVRWRSHHSEESSALAGRNDTAT